MNGWKTDDYFLAFLFTCIVHHTNKSPAQASTDITIWRYQSRFHRVSVNALLLPFVTSSFFFLLSEGALLTVLFVATTFVAIIFFHACKILDPRGAGGLCTRFCQDLVGSIAHRTTLHFLPCSFAPSEKKVERENGSS